ncbi:MAG: NAD(P)/FAD-dependent oxidoreductase [Rhodospirillales bacterium]|nr:NAD(P)/FAD-dependent oxidoreductase [Rhodospirillales bacterium]
MAIEKLDVVVVGGGQAGVAMSEHLSANGLSHVVLERGRIAERWRSERWDSLVANGPAWHDRFPGLTFPGDPGAFVPKEQVADYFVSYAEKIKAPIRCGVEVISVTRLDGKFGFSVETTDGTFEAGFVVAATGAFQTPIMPDLIPAQTGMHQIHSASYRNPDQLPDGAVLVVGAGSSGTQIAQELMTSGRKVYLSVGPHDRPPRSYRGRDFVWWLGVLNKWDAEATPEADHVTIAVSGANGGHTVDFRNLAHQGMILLGRTEGYNAGKLKIAPDLAKNIDAGDANYLAVLDEADAFIAQNGLDLPEEPEARMIGADPECISDPVLELDLQDAGISAVIWATGFERDYGWLKFDIFDETGAPFHTRGISKEPGIYFLGLPWQTRRGSSFIWGVWYDAKYLADHMSKQQNYLAYSPTS